MYKKFKNKKLSHKTILINLFLIVKDFSRGFYFLKKYSGSVPMVSMLGSAGYGLPQKYYILAEEIGEYIANKGWVLITGGGPGIMEAGNKGAHKIATKQKKILSISSGILLPNEQAVNKYSQKNQSFRFFFSRKKILFCGAQVYIFLPGGFGTLDEFFEVITLIQTRKQIQVPMLLVGKEFWIPLLNFIENNLAEKWHTIQKKDVELYKIFDSTDEVKAYLDSININKYCRSFTDTGFFAN